MSLNPTYCPGCAGRGRDLGLERALTVRLNVKLSAAYVRIESLEQDVRLLRGMRRDDPRRNVLGPPGDHDSDYVW